jgi:hypothetical protein
MLGLGVMAVLAQSLDEIAGLLGWVLCHGRQAAGSGMRPH